MSRVIGRINIDELDLAQVGLLKELEGVEVVALDEQVLRCVEIDGSSELSVGDRVLSGGCG